MKLSNISNALHSHGYLLLEFYMFLKSNIFFPIHMSAQLQIYNQATIFSIFISIQGSTIFSLNSFFNPSLHIDLTFFYLIKSVHLSTISKTSIGLSFAIRFIFSRLNLFFSRAKYVSIGLYSGLYGILNTNGISSF